MIDSPAHLMLDTLVVYTVLLYFICQQHVASYIEVTS